MKVIQRFGYYLGGFSIGLIMLAFFLKGSGTEIPSCDYMPEARVLKNIRNKGYVVSENAEAFMRSINVDTLQLNRVLKEGKVVFDKSDPRRKPCGCFYIQSPNSEKVPIGIEVSNCEDQATITSVEKLSDVSN